VIPVLEELRQLGYEVQVDGDHVCLRWRGDGEPPRERVLPLVEEVKRRKAEVVAALTTTGMTAVDPAAAASAMTVSSRRAILADPVEPCSPNVQPAAHDPNLAMNDECCGWCGSTMLWHADTGSGRIYCETCHSVYHPSQGCWTDGERAKQRLPVL
jgi:hypothetical protein